MTVEGCIDVFGVGNDAKSGTEIAVFPDDADPTSATPIATGVVAVHTILDDCGTDGVCFTDEGWTAPDADGSENDGVQDDYWLDCGLDRLCPDNVPEDEALRDNGRDDDGDGAIDDGAYPGPDEGEGDGVFQALWIAGYGNNRPAMLIKDALQARAIAFRQGDTTLALCAVDAVGLLFDEQLEIAARVEAAIPGEVDLVLVQASHTHEAPDTMGQ